MGELNLEITDSQYTYGFYYIDTLCVDERIPNDATITHRKIRKRKWTLDCAFVHYLVKELILNAYYRKCFVEYNSLRRYGKIYDWFVLKLKPTTCDLIDYNWNERVYIMIRERLELNHMFSWLSTLGGAFSALGDYSENCALKAGKISLNQFKLALRLGDPGIQARCRLYFALSLIQRKYLKCARNIIYKEYKDAKSTQLVDVRLVNMCKGIWAKLQYEQRLIKSKRRA